VLVRDLFTCQMAGCGRIEPDTSKLVADHKVAHRGDERLFWDEQNLQCLCKDCHDRLKQSEERSSMQARGVWY
jgi:5-methylcytosine-specific restriction endonuclease McrA